MNITRRCNMKCDFCFYSDLLTFPTAQVGEPGEALHMPLESARERLASVALGHIYVSGGEPLMHPELRALTEWLLPRCDGVSYCTNGMLLTDDWLTYCASHGIRLLWSFRGNEPRTFAKMTRAVEKGVEVHAYHVLRPESLPALQGLARDARSVSAVRLLYGAGSESNGVPMVPCDQWYELLVQAHEILEAIADRVEVELAFAPAGHPIARDPRRGAVDRLYMDVDGRVYACPLLVYGDDGSEQVARASCAPERCPILQVPVQCDADYARICPFVLASLADIPVLAPRRATGLDLAG